MTTAYPVERSARVSNAAAFNGVDDTFGPFTFEIFDALDVVVEIRDIGEDYWLPTTAVTVTKGPDSPDHFTITFDAVQPDTKEFRVRGARIHERSISLSKGTGLNMDALARVHAEIAFTLQELRRDADVLNNAATLEAAAQAIEAAEAAVLALQGVQEAQGVVTQLKDDVILLKAAVDQAKTDAEAAAQQATLNATAVLGYGRVPVGFMIPWHGLKAPNQYWVLVDTVGQVFSRSLFPALLDVFAPEFVVSFSNGNPVVTGIDCPQKLKAGWPVEGTNIPGGTTILSVDSPSQITLSANPTGDGTAIRIFPHGNGDGSTTAHYPALAGRVTRGLDRTGALNPDADNVVGETQEDAFQGHYHNHRANEGTFSAGGGANVFSKFGSYGEVVRTNVVEAAVTDGVNGTPRTAAETRVKSIIAPYIVKVADGVDDPAIIAAAQVVSDLAAAQAAIASLEAKAGAVAILEYQQPSGTSGGSTVATTWTVWPVNTEVSDPNGIVSLSSNQFTPMVDCDCDVEVILLRSHYHRIRIFNVTDGVVVGEPGPGTFAHPTYGDQAISTVRRLLTAGKTYQIEYWASVALVTDGLGAATSSGAAEVFGSVTLRAI